MRPMRPYLLVALVVSLMAADLTYGAAEHIGIVKSMAGEVLVTRGALTIKAEPNATLFEGDVIQTGANGKAGLILGDDTVISMGANSTVDLKAYQFQPQEKKLSLIARVLHGTASFLSGQIAKLAPKRVQVETPHATVGVRGTHFLVRVD
jgi:hypothetical protein